jgi:hypothetical protein
MPDPARWISVGELAEAFGPDNFTPPRTAELAGSAHTLHFEDGRAVGFQFLSESRLVWKTGDGDGHEADYFALKPRDGIYFVDLFAGEAPPTTLSLVLDLGRKMATSLVACLPDAVDVGESLAARVAREEELTAVTAEFASASVDVPFSGATPRHAPTADLVGRRVEYTYSATERYEHIYLNEHFYTWHCLLGSEKGLADTDRCHYLELADDLYLFVWREKIVPTLGALVVDFQALRTMGKIFGHGRDGGAHGGSAGVVDFPVGARARLLNMTPLCEEIGA